MALNVRVDPQKILAARAVGQESSAVREPDGGRDAYEYDDATKARLRSILRHAKGEPLPEYTPYIPPKTQEEWRKQFAVQLFWSNPECSDERLLRQALLSARWNIVLSAARLFGAERLQKIYEDWRKNDPDDFREKFRNDQNFVELLLQRASLGLYE